MPRSKTSARPQISAEISEETKSRFEAYTDAHGLKKGYVVEQALLYHLQAMRELPADVIIPPRVVITPESMDELATRFQRSTGPTAAMTALRSGDASQLDDSVL
jgi:hypothetical protein